MNASDQTKKLDDLQFNITESIERASALYKLAEKDNWSEERVAEGDAAMQEVVRLHNDFSEVLKQHESWLVEQGWDLSEPEISVKPLEQRWWRNQLTTKEVEPTDEIEVALSQGLSRLISLAPTSWWDSQKAAYQLGLKERLIEPLVLYAGQRFHTQSLRAHRFAELLCLAERNLAAHDDLDIYAAAFGVPLLAGLCVNLDAIISVAGGLKKLKELFTTPGNEIDSRIYELLVSGALARKGRKVSFIPETPEKSPDLRIFDLPFPTTIECKFQSWIADKEQDEINWITTLFETLVQAKKSQGLLGVMSISFTKEIDLEAWIPMAASSEVISKLTRINPYGAYTFHWGTMELEPLPPSTTLVQDTRLYSTEFLHELFGWIPEQSGFDGLCVHVDNAYTVRTDRIEFPFVLRWKFESENAQKYKTRPIIRLLAEAFKQIPTGEAGIVFAAYREGHRAQLADRKTQDIRRLFDSRDFFIKRQKIAMPMLVINRVYANSVGHGLPDLIENSIPLIDGGDDREIYDLWCATIPTAVFTSGSSG